MLGLFTVNPEDEIREFAFRPRFKALAGIACIFGFFFAAFPFVVTLSGSGDSLFIIGGTIGCLLGLLYLRSPAWKIRVVVDEEHVEVLAGEKRRFILAWDEVDHIVASPGTKTCFVDGGRPEHSLLVPGLGASAPYAIENSGKLFDFIIAHTQEDKIRTVPFLEGYEEGDQEG